jgi:hypothetical protein
VLLVAVSHPLETACRQAAAQAAEARLEVCDVSSATTQAALHRPFALLVPNDILEFDPEEFRALAKTVNASLVRIPNETDSKRLVARLIEALSAASARRSP